MRTISAILAMALLLCASVSWAADEAKTPKKEEMTLDQKVSYMIGLQMGSQLKTIPIELDKAILLKSFQDALAGKDPLFTDEEGMQIQKDFQAKMKADQEKKAAENKIKGEAFLAENKKKPGVKTTESGLQYLVLKKGDGATPTDTDEATVHYRGTLIDGEEFDKSYEGDAPTDADKPFTFPLRIGPGGRGSVIDGWLEAAKLMKVGDKFRLFISSDLAYGEAGSRSGIGPNETLIFDVELLKVAKSQPPAMSRMPGMGVRTMPPGGTSMPPGGTSMPEQMPPNPESK